MKLTILSILLFLLVGSTFQLIVWNLPDVPLGFIPEKVESCYNKIKLDLGIRSECDAVTRSKWYPNGQQDGNQRQLCCSTWDYIDCALLNKGKIKCDAAEYDTLKKYWDENHEKLIQAFYGHCGNYPYPSTSSQCKSSSMPAISKSVPLWTI